MNKKKIYPVWFVFGALIIYGALYFVPGIIGIGYSFTDWSSYSNELNFVGFENFAKIFSSENKYLFYILNTLKFTILTIALKTVIGLLIALPLAKKSFMNNFYRTMFFVPAVLSLLVTGLVFRSIFNPETGLLNTLFNTLGLESFAQQWLVDPKTAFGSIIFVDVWRGTGYIMCIILAGLQSIPQRYYEAAKIDGANGVQSFFRITLPMLMPTLAVTTVLNLLYGLKVFDIVFVLTNGERRVTEVLYTSVFREFSQGKYAQSTAMSSLMFVFMVVIGYFILRIMNRSTNE